MVVVRANRRLNASRAAPLLSGLEPGALWSEGEEVNTPLFEDTCMDRGLEGKGNPRFERGLGTAPERGDARKVLPKRQRCFATNRDPHCSRDEEESTLRGASSLSTISR